MACSDILTLTGPTDEVHQCQRRKKRHKKHRARLYGADDLGTFAVKVTWRRSTPTSTTTG
jgi:hypothetical protein